MNIKPLNITVTIPAKTVRILAEEATVVHAGLDEVDNPALLELGLTRQGVVNDLAASPDFHGVLAKCLESVIRDSTDWVSDELCEHKIPSLVQLERALQKIQARRNTEEAEREHLRETKAAIKLLKDQGYAVTK